MVRRWSRRSLLAGGVSLTGLAGLAGVGALASGLVDPGWEEERGPYGVIPSAPPGDERIERRFSTARGREVSCYTAVPAGYGDGRGLPVCLVLHGASATADDFSRFGLGRFLSDVVARGGSPFVLAGATGDRLAWQPSGDDDPRRMVYEELPRWCAERGFDTSRLAVWGWSMGGFGALLLAATRPGFVRAVAAFSPAVRPGDAVFRAVDRLRGTPVGLWCGRSDDFHEPVRELEQSLPEPPVAGGYEPGGHTRGYWNRITPAAFDFIATTLSHPAP